MFDLNWKQATLIVVLSPYLVARWLTLKALGRTGTPAVTRREGKQRVAE